LGLLPLSRSSPPTIPPRASRHNPESGPETAFRRADLDRAEFEWLKRGGPTKADLKIVDFGDGPVVVKDFAAKAAWVRLIGRLQIRRECGAYRWLGGLAGIPRFVGQIDAHAMAIEHVDGQPLVFVPRDRLDGRKAHARLSAIVEGMHAARLFHLDLRGRDNVLFDAEGRVFIIDLASAIWFRRSSLARALFAGWLAQADRSALLKWKSILGAGPLTEDEQSFLRRYGFWRSLWIFNPKRRRSR
jgi:hypothetical protein